MARTPSVTYAGGELAPGLHGRVDLAKYATGLEFAENFLVSAEGGVTKRPGTRYVGQTLYGPNDPVRLLEWQVADDDSYILELGRNYIRFIRFGALLAWPGAYDRDPRSRTRNFNQFVLLDTPWGASEIRDIKFCYANDVMYLFHPGRRPYLLKRYGVYDWSLEELQFEPPGGAPQITSIQFIAGPKDEGVRYAESLVPMFYQVSAEFSDGTESRPSTPFSVDADLGYRTNRNVLRWSEASPPPGVFITRYLVYKARGGEYGFVAAVNNLTWEDRNVQPATDRPPRGTFDALQEFVGGWPRVGEFHKQRLAVAGTQGLPEGMFFSRAAIFDDFATSRPVQADDGFSFTLVGGTRHAINHLVPLKDLLVFTDTAEWVVRADNGVLSPSTAIPDPQSYYGASPHLRPLKINERVLFVEDLSNTVRDFGYRIDADGLVADDLSRLSRHLFKGTQIINWTYTAFPNNLVVAALGNGRMAHMTYDRDQEVWGWTHSTTNGQVLEVASVPEFNQNGLYLVVQRNTVNGPRNFIERMDQMPPADAYDAFHVDCGLSFRDEWNRAIFLIDQELIAVTGPSIWGAGTEIELVVPNGPRGYFFYFPAPHGGNLYPSRGFDLTPWIGQTFSGAQLFRCVTRVSGLDHLNTHVVTVLADGAHHPPVQVLNGAIELNRPCGRVHVGLGYGATLRTLDLDIQQEFATFEHKTISEVSVRLINSAVVLAGRKGEPLYQLKDPAWELGGDRAAWMQGAFTVSADGEWNMQVGVEVQSPGPYPCTVLNIVPDIQYGRSR